MKTQGMTKRVLHYNSEPTNKYRVVRGRDSDDFYIQIRYEPKEKRRLFPLAVWAKPKYTYGYVGHKSHASWVITRCTNYSIDPTMWFSTIEDAHRVINLCIAQDRTDNSYTGDWQP